MMRKMDELEATFTGLAARFAFAFTTLSLLVWSIIQFIQEKETGWQFSIMMVSLTIFFVSKLILTRKSLRRKRNG